MKQPLQLRSLFLARMDATAAVALLVIASCVHPPGDQANGVLTHTASSDSNSGTAAILEGEAAVPVTVSSLETQGELEIMRNQLVMNEIDANAVRLTIETQNGDVLCSQSIYSSTLDPLRKLANEEVAGSEVGDTVSCPLQVPSELFDAGGTVGAALYVCIDSDGDTSCSNEQTGVLGGAAEDASSVFFFSPVTLSRTDGQFVLEKQPLHEINDTELEVMDMLQSISSDSPDAEVMLGTLSYGSLKSKANGQTGQNGGGFLAKLVNQLLGIFGLGDDSGGAMQQLTGGLFTKVVEGGTQGQVDVQGVVNAFMDMAANLGEIVGQVASSPMCTETIEPSIAQFFGEECQIEGFCALIAAAVNGNTVENGGTMEYEQLTPSIQNCEMPEREHGCFAMGTKISVGPNQWIPVERVRQGTVVMTSDGRRVEVERFVVGPEKHPIVSLTTASQDILRVTRDHPMVTVSGLKRADTLTLQDKLVLASGGSTAIASLGSQTYTLPVFNFAVKGEGTANHLVVANGLVTGDLAIQEQLSADLHLSKTSQSVDGTNP